MTTLLRKPRAFAATHVGQRRKNNEDAFICDDELGLYVVADGMGGHAAGEIASETATEQILGMVKREFATVDRALADPNELHDEMVRRLLESAVQAAAYMVFAMAEQEPEQHGMGTTISALLIAGRVGYIAQVGDSRVYLYRNQQLAQVTEDHTWINLQVKLGRMTPEEAMTARNKNVITRSVGVCEYAEVDTFDITLHPGDRFLLSSDGLHDYAPEPAHLLPMVQHADLETAVSTMIEFANASGGKDNVTVILVEYPPVG